MASERSCEQCGRRFTPKSARARFCGSTCRSEAHRSKTAAVISLPLVETSTLSAVKAELAGADRLDTSLGQVAVTLAARIDAGNESGAAVAALSRELRAVRNEVLADVDVPDSRVARLKDELAARRHG